MNNITKLRPIPIVEDTKRPYRLWDVKAKKNIPHRYYLFPRKAHLGALIEVRWGEVGTVIEVYDCRTAALLGQYKRTPTSVQFFDIRLLNKMETSNGNKS